MIELLAMLALSGSPALPGAVAAPAPAVAPAPPRSRFENGVLTLVMGERAILRRAEDGSFSLVKAEAANGEATAEPGTVVFTLRNTMGTSLLVQSGLDKAFRYDAYFDSRRRQKTSTCTVMAGIMGFEQWGEAVAAFTLTNFRVVGDDAMVCD
jgi:hypothetical protein